MARIRNPNDLKKRSSKTSSNIDNARGSNLRNNLSKANNNNVNGQSRHSSQSYNPNIDFVEKKVKPKDKKFVTDISDPNQLYKFATYNYLFTLSALNTSDLLDTKTLLKSKPHDIIIRSAGIGPTANTKEFFADDDYLDADNRKIVNSNDRLRKSMLKSQIEFVKNNDMYFTSVTMNNIPGLNEKRRLTSVTSVNMEIVEPFGITLLEKLRAAAANNNFLDHLDAPFMLTLEFKGFDVHGKPIPADQQTNLKRVIPIKITNMDMDVNQAGTTYSVKAIPYNEMAYLDRYNYVRTSGTISLDGTQAPKTLNGVAKQLENVLNKQNTDEKKDNLVGIPDQYEIYIDKFFKPDTVQINAGAINQVGMTKKVAVIDPGVIDGEADVPVEFMKLAGNEAITKILEEIMKAHPDMSDDKLEKWEAKVRKTLKNAQKDGEQAVYDRSKGDDMHFDYFRIRSSVIPTAKFDQKRKRNVKIVKFVVEPYKVHAYSLAIPGVSTGQNYKNFVYKTYNYIFTGDNVDILDLNIQYKYAYFTGTLKDVDADGKRQNQIQQASEDTRGTDTTDDANDSNMNYASEVITSKSEGTGRTKGGFIKIDQFLDYITHPLADMVSIRMEILGDPAWMGQSQFIPANPFAVKDGESEDKDISYWRGARDAIWSDEFRCYNADIAEPIIMLNFKMPTDINTKKGTYEISKAQQANFSGLYRVVVVENNFVNGQYTNVLTLVRFNNQGVYISSPTASKVIKTKTGESFVTTNAGEYNKLLASLNEAGGFIKSVTNIGRTIDNLIADAKKKITGFFS